MIIFPLYRETITVQNSVLPQTPTKNCSTSVGLLGDSAKYQKILNMFLKNIFLY